jgi:indole-3-glycerol phosphate synthase/phosphoribosylanthranilate isomerase
VAGLLSAFGQRPGDFWARLCARVRPGRPLVKICGITRPADAERAAALGADALGFVFARSKRRAQPALLRDLADLDVLKVAVVVSGETGSPAGLDPELKELLEEGLLDAVQFHGDEQPEECASLAFPYYKAVRVRGPAELAAMASYRCPRVLADAWSPHAAGGTGERIPLELARELAGHAREAHKLERVARKGSPLWLAGGLGPETVGEVVRELSPELIDASSGLEESPGCKDRTKLENYFREIDRNAQV